MRSLLALLAAVSMVVGAIVVRARIDHQPVPGRHAAGLRLTCATEMEKACNALASSRDDIEVSVEAASDTADRLAALADGAPTGFDGWLVPAPWPQIVAEARARTGRTPALGAPSPAIGRSPIVIVAWRDRAAVLSRRCKGEVGWRCVGDAAAADSWAALGGEVLWGPFKPFHPDATREASGLLAASAATVSFLGRTDFSSADLEDDAYSGWYSGLERALPPSRSSGAAAVQELLLTGPSVYDVVGALESDAAPLVAVSARRGEVQVIYPSPMVTADAVLVGPTSGGRARDLTRIVTGDPGRAALGSAGWRVPGQPPATGGIGSGPALPRGNGLPSPGALEALRAKTREIR